MVTKSYDKDCAAAITYPYLVETQSTGENLTEEMSNWCSANCVNFWMIGPVLPIKVFHHWTYWFVFQDDQDAMFFKMRWK